MLFQVIDPKYRCQNIFADGEITATFKEDFTHTWSYHPILKDKNIEFASLYAQTDSLQKVCPEHLIEELKQVEKDYRVFVKAFDTAQVVVGNHCFYDLLPEYFLKRYFGLKNKITQHVFENYEKPSHYDFLLDLAQLLQDIENRKLNIDLRALSSGKKHRAKSLFKRIKNNRSYIKYNEFGTVTGRLGLKKDSFPILNLDKEYRSVLKPNNDLFLEIDFNAAELRTVLALNGEPQPQKDLHQWHIEVMQKIYKEEISREEVKKKIFSWLYNPTADTIGIKAIEKAYDKKKIREKYWDGQYIVTPYGRKIRADAHHVFNYLIQSTTSDNFLRRAIELYKMLQGCKSYIAWIIHDSLVIDLASEEMPKVKEALVNFGETEFGNFILNKRIGKNFKDMKG